MGEAGVKHPTPLILQCPEDMVDSPLSNITPSSVNSPLERPLEIEWELQKEFSKRQNPEVQFTSSSNPVAVLQFAANTTQNHVPWELVISLYVCSSLSFQYIQ